MREIGGYIEFEHYHGSLYHDRAVALNCGRSALAYLWEAKGIRELYLPYFLCDSVVNLCRKLGIGYRFYPVGPRLEPLFNQPLPEGAWLYLVNYYGQLTDEEIRRWKARYDRVIVDNAQSYFQMPAADGVDTLYTCRKYFGVADGAFLYTDARLERPLEQDESHDRMHFLLGRFERPASEFYAEYAANNDFFDDEPVKQMSRLTENLLRGVDYPETEKRRKDNFAFLHRALGAYNQLELAVTGTFMYPFLVPGGAALRQKLQQQKIYIPTLWPSVQQWCTPEMPEYHYAMDILPLPCDQRYTREDMAYMVQKILEEKTEVN